MKHLIIAILAMGSSTAAFADGFTCTSVDGDLNVKVYNHTDASAGTRNASVMILSDATVQAGRKTIAKFDADNTLLTNSAASYEANVDLRYSDSNRAGENIGGTKLGQIDTIALDVDFTYARPVQSGDMLDGKLTITKRNGQEIRINMDCERYLKN